MYGLAVWKYENNSFVISLKLVLAKAGKGNPVELLKIWIHALVYDYSATVTPRG